MVGKFRPPSGGAAGQMAAALGSDISSDAGPEVGQRFIAQGVEGQHGRAEP